MTAPRKPSAAPVVLALQFVRAPYLAERYLLDNLILGRSPSHGFSATDAEIPTSPLAVGMIERGWVEVVDGALRATPAGREAARHGAR